MSGLAITQAPPPARPLRFLLTAPAWGLVAGAWLLWHGESALASRWAMPTVVLVHLFTLGVLGNAMLGSLLQFLPVAAGSPMAQSRSAPLLHAVFNAGLLAFVPGVMWAHRPALLAAALALGLSLLAFAVLALAAVARGHGPRWLRCGIGMALTALVATAGLGVALCAVLLGRLALPLDRVVDLHAALGLLGWTLLLMAVVGSVTLPMFQGTRPVPVRALYGWIAVAVTGLLVGGGLRLTGSRQALAVAVAVPALLLAAASLWWQWRARHRRNPALTGFWASGTIAIAGACLLLLDAVERGSGDILVGLLGIGIGLPLMLLGMLQEIVAFLAWIDLRRRCPRGQRIPGVDRLLPESDKQRALAAHLVAAALLLAAVRWPGLASLAGTALLAAYALTGHSLLRCLQRARRFLPASEERP